MIRRAVAIVSLVLVAPLHGGEAGQAGPNFRAGTTLVEFTVVVTEWRF